MVVKINSKPVQVKQEAEKDFSWTYLAVSTFGYGLILYTMDYMSRIFLGKSQAGWIFRTVKFIGNVIMYIGDWIEWIF